MRPDLVPESQLQEPPAPPSQGAHASDAQASAGGAELVWLDSTTPAPMLATAPAVAPAMAQAATGTAGSVAPPHAHDPPLILSARPLSASRC
mgnify:CR=1 FL=1